MQLMMHADVNLVAVFRINSHSITPSDVYRRHCGPAPRSPPRAGGLFAFFCILLRLYFMLITHRNFPSRAADKLLFISAEWS